jgi:drug/metabolite transporter (DMT)-like permease
LPTANISFVGALVHTTAANTLVIMAATPLFSALMGRVFIGEGVSRRTWLTIFSAFGGVVLIFSESLGSGSGGGDLFAVLAALSQAAALVMLRHAGCDDIFPILGLAGFLGVAMVWPFAEPLGVFVNDLIILAVVGLVMLPVAFGLFLTGVKWVPAAAVSLMALIETVLGPLLVWLVIGEEPSRWALAGGAVVLCAIVFNAAGALHERNNRISG